MRARALPPLPIIAPVGAPAIELPRYADAFEHGFREREAWERDQAFDDERVPAHEYEQFVRRRP
jgi:hypothetical protein